MHPARKCPGDCPEAWREQANVVQLEEQARRSGGTRVNETPQRIADKAAARASGAGAAGRIASSRHPTAAARTRPFEEGQRNHKKDLGVSLQLLTNREKTLLVDALKQTHALSDLLSEHGLARSSYFCHRPRLQVADKYAGARQAIAEIFELNHRCYGYRRIQAALGRQCVRLSEKVVQRLMKQECLVVAKPKRRRYGSYLGEIGPAPDNLIDRDFQAAAPNMKWLTDITDSNFPLARCIYDRLLRRDGRQLVDRHSPGRRACEQHVGRRGREGR